MSLMEPGPTLVTSYFYHLHFGLPRRVVPSVFPLEATCLDHLSLSLSLSAPSLCVTVSIIIIIIIIIIITATAIIIIISVKHTAHNILSANLIN